MVLLHSYKLLFSDHFGAIANHIKNIQIKFSDHRASFRHPPKAALGHFAVNKKLAVRALCWSAKRNKAVFVIKDMRGLPILGIIACVFVEHFVPLLAFRLSHGI